MSQKKKILTNFIKKKYPTEKAVMVFLKDLFYIPYFFCSVNDLKQAIKICMSITLQMIPTYYIQVILSKNKFINIDLKSIGNWLNANKISLNVKKTDMIIFKSKRKKIKDIVKISGRRIYPTVSVKYFGVKIVQHPTWQHHI